MYLRQIWYSIQGRCSFAVLLSGFMLTLLLNGNIIHDAYSNLSMLIFISV